VSAVIYAQAVDVRTFRFEVDVRVVDGEPVLVAVRLNG